MLSLALNMRVILFVILTILATVRVAANGGQCSHTSFNVKDGFQDRVLPGRRLLKTTTVQVDPQCFSECSKDCRCMSFNVCGKTCQLNAVNRFLLPNLLLIKKGCRYYDMPQAKGNCGSTSNGLPGICCARLPTLCLNGGVCHVDTSDTTRRFQCTCPPGYYGNQCEARKPKSCLDFWTGPIDPISGKYTIEDESATAHEVFCDFDSEEGVAWTLIESFSMNNELQLRPYPFTLDYPLNVNNMNWELFRLPKSLMVALATRSKYWRGTCSYADYEVDYRDYVRVRVSELDFTVYIGHKCVLVDYFDLKGTNCINCTAQFFQIGHELFHGNVQLNNDHCSFTDVGHWCSSEQARQLGLYGLCSDPLYRCTESSSSTTQFWFGQTKT